MTWNAAVDQLKYMRARSTNQNLLKLREAFRIARFASCFVIVFVGSGCAPKSYMGISLIPGEASAELQAVAAQARSGDKTAQLNLAKHFEKDVSGAESLRKAMKLYALAASDTGGAYTLRVPTASGITSIPIDAGPRKFGLSEARTALQTHQVKRKSEETKRDKTESIESILTRYQTNGYLDGFCKPTPLEKAGSVKSDVLYVSYGRAMGPAIKIRNKKFNSIKSSVDYVLFDSVAERQLKSLISRNSYKNWFTYTSSVYEWKLISSYLVIDGPFECRQGQSVDKIYLISQVYSINGI